LLEHGIILRPRQAKNGFDDFTIKLCSALSQIGTECRKLEGFKLEGN
jgi:hypothetical protein